MDDRAEPEGQRRHGLILSYPLLLAHLVGLLFYQALKSNLSFTNLIRLALPHISGHLQG